MAHFSLKHVIVFLASMTTTAQALGPISVHGYKFFDSETGDEFIVKGIDYFPRPNEGTYNYNSADLFTDAHRNIWERDIKYLQDLGVNTIRLYAVDPNESHDEFM
jgi:1,3-beta-glucanosyltransferase GAS5